MESSIQVQDQAPLSPAKASGTHLSDLVKEMVKEMDANEFYSRGDVYDQSAEEPWFSINVGVAGEDGGAVVQGASLRKPWSEFQRLHYLLLTDEFGCDTTVREQLPTLPAGLLSPSEKSADAGGEVCESRPREPGGTSGGIARGLDAYMKALLAVPAVVRSQVFSGFLEEHSRHEHRGDGGSGSATDQDPSSDQAQDDEEAPSSPQTAVDFLLQPFDFTNAYVPRRTDHVARIDVIRGESVVWKFEVMDHLDINFSVVFRPHPVALSSHPAANAEDAAHVSPLELESKPPSPGHTETEEAGPTSEESSYSRTRRRSSGWWRAGRDSSRDGDCSPAGGEPGSWRGAVGTTRQTGAGDARKVDKMRKDQTVHLPTRYHTGGGDLVQGSYTCPADGTCILQWDNSYSRLRGKRLRFVVESVTVQTMRAAIEAAGAVDHKRRTTRSIAAQKILDSREGEVQISVTAIGSGGDCQQEDESGTSCNDDSVRRASGDVKTGDTFSRNQYRFGGARRIAAALLRDLGTIVDAQEMLDGVEMGGRIGRERSLAGSGGEVRSSCSAQVDAHGVEILVEKFEVLEDEVAKASARRAQSEAQAKVLLANLQKANTKYDRLDRELEETKNMLATACAKLEDTEVARDEAVAAAGQSTSRLQKSEEQLLRARRALDLLQAERSVWQVARSGIQEELAKVVGELEVERHRHEDTSRALAKSHEARAHAEAESARLSRRLEEERGGAGGARMALAAERDAARLAREEAEDARAAVAELDAAVAELGAQKRVLVAGLRARERSLGDRCAVAEARAEEAAMMRRAADARVRELEEEAERREVAQADAEIKLQRLRVEKRVLLAEIRRGVGGGAARAEGIVVSGQEVGGSGGEKVNEGHIDTAGDTGSESGSSSISGGAGRKGWLSPRGGAEGMHDSKAALKQLSRQLVHLRERQHHLREDLQVDRSNISAQRQEADVNRAVQNLETRIRRLLSVAAAGDDDASLSAESPPADPTMSRKSIEAPSVSEVQAAEVETFSV